jgi:hypothetical protein
LGKARLNSPERMNIHLSVKGRFIVAFAGKEISHKWRLVENAIKDI